jgi:hypothetical protein
MYTPFSKEIQAIFSIPQVGEKSNGHSPFSHGKKRILGKGAGAGEKDRAKTDGRGEERGKQNTAREKNGYGGAGGKTEGRAREHMGAQKDKKDPTRPRPRGEKERPPMPQR